MTNITITRGDTARLKFRRLDNNGNIILSPAEKVFFTVKQNINNKRAVLQKTLEDMDFNTSSGYYTFTIEPADTDSLEALEYIFDIEVITDEYKQTICIGKLTLNADVTLPINEG